MRVKSIIFEIEEADYNDYLEESRLDENFTVDDLLIDDVFHEVTPPDNSAVLVNVVDPNREVLLTLCL